VLFCYDGSEGSRGAMRAAGQLIEPSNEAVLLTVWEPIAVRLALSGAFAACSVPYDSDLDKQEESFAKAAAEEGAQRAVEHGYKALRTNSDGHSPPERLPPSLPVADIGPPCALPSPSTSLNLGEVSRLRDRANSSLCSQV
jgi:hypothetical protein